MGAVDPITDLNDVKQIYNRFFMWGKHREAELVVFGCNVAMRITDMLNVKFADINPARHEGNITHYTELIEGRARKPRRVNLNESAMTAVNNLKNRFSDNIYLFQSNRSHPKPAPVTRQWVFMCVTEVAASLELDYKLNTHSLRKIFGYHAYKSGIDINALQKLFNHSSVSITMGYIGIIEKRVQDVYQAINVSL